MAALNQAFESIALKLQEAATGLSHDDIRRRLADTIAEQYRDSGHWCYIVDVFGDDQSGDCIYCCDGDLCKASYEIKNAGDKASCMIDFENCVGVVPTTSYQEEMDDADHYVAMESGKLYGDVPTYERFISKADRSKADSSSFAGKGRSFPILKPADVMAAVRSIGRAGSDNYDAGTLKRNIIKIAKAKGWESELPKAWRGSEAAKESEESAGSGLKLREDFCDFLEPVQLRESARADYPVKIIAPGKGSTAYYTEEMLKANVGHFKPGMHLYWNHPSLTEESDRPERSIDHLAAVLTQPGIWDDNGPAGKGIYSRAKVFSDHAQQVEEKGPYIGLSILGGGMPEMSGGKPLMREGVPVLKSFTHIASTDFVTHAGAGGMPIMESASAEAPVGETPTSPVEEVAASWSFKAMLSNA